MEAMEIDKKLHKDFFVVSSGDAFSYNIETSLEMEGQWLTKLRILDNGIILRSLVDLNEDEWDW